MARRWHAVVPNAYLAWMAMSLKCMSAAGMTDAIKVTSGAWINLTYALVFVSMLLLAAQARQRTLPSFRWPFPPPPHRLRSHRTCNERLRLVRWQWPVTPAGKAQLWSQKFDGDALTSGGQIDIGDDALGMAIQVPRPPVRLDDTQ